MITPEHVAQIKARLAQGASPEIVKSTVLNAGGITEAEIDQVLSMLRETPRESLLRPINTPLSAQAPYQAPVQAPVVQNIPTFAPPTLSKNTYVTPPARPTRHWVKYFIIILALLLLVGLGAGAVYAYLQGYWPFSTSVYTESNIFSGILEKTANVHSLTYRLEINGNIGPREAGAKPFTYQVADQAAIDKTYNNDYLRMQEVSRILSSLTYSYTTYNYNSSNYSSSGTTHYPSTLSKIVSDYNKSYATLPSYQITGNDPITNVPFSYIVSPDGKQYALSVTFETDNAIKTIEKSFGYSATSTPIHGKTVTFTSNSLYSSSIYLPERAPDPFLVQMANSAAYAPSEGSVSASFGATTDIDKSDWTFNLDGKGDFGDVSYKVDMDALRKDSQYYVRVNNFPLLPFIGDLSDIKGQWINLSQGSSTSSESPLSYVATEIPNMEKDYKDQRAQSANFMREVAKIAGDTKLVQFKDMPRKETLADGRKVYRYDIMAREEAVLPFYQKLLADTQANPSLVPQGLFIDPGLVTYLQSEEFKNTYDYLNQNTSITVWVDASGLPAKVEYDLRIVPPDTATKLASKQINISFSLLLSDLNKSVNISAPSDAKTLHDLFGAQMDQQTIQNALSYLRYDAETYYSTHQSYGGFCAGGDKYLKASTYPSNKAPICNASGSTYAVAAPLTTSGYWCVDSVGYEGSITNAIGKKTSCR